jgi:hypothetical protein
MKAFHAPRVLLLSFFHGRRKALYCTYKHCMEGLSFVPERACMAHDSARRLGLWHLKGHVLE